MKIPKSADDSHLYRDYFPALKRWWRQQAHKLNPNAKEQGMLTLLCDEVADLLQLNTLKKKLLMLT